MSKPAAETPKNAETNGVALHAIYAAAGAGGLCMLVGVPYQEAGMLAGLALASNYAMNNIPVLADSMTILPHDMAAALIVALTAYFYVDQGSYVPAMAAFIGANNAPNIAAFMKFPDKYAF